MSVNLLKASVAPTGNIIMPKMRMMYAQLFVAGPPAKGETDEKRFQWGIVGLIPADADLSALEERIQELFEEEVPASKRERTNWKYPIMETAKDNGVSMYAEEYPYFIRPNAKAFTRAQQARPKPDVVGPDGKPVDPAEDAEECYNGRWFRCSLNPYWYPPNQGKPGVSLGLVNVQLLDHDEPLAGGKPSADSEFEAVGDDELADLT
jgi:hypothetical protein